MARTAAPALVLALLLLTPAAAAWEQYRGGSDRNGRLLLPAGPLDVVAVGHFPEGWMTRYANGAPSVTTPHGVFYLLLHADGRCELALMRDPLALAVEELPLEGCTNGGMLLAYDAAQDLLFVCVTGEPSSKQLRALDARTLEMRWGVSAQGFGSASQPALWECQGGGFDPSTRELIVPFYAIGALEATTESRLASVDVRSGTLNWLREIPGASARTASGVGGLPEPVPAVSDTPRTVTITENGIVLMSVHTAFARFSASMKMFDREGRPTHASLASSGAGLANIASHYAVGRGALAMLVYSNSLVLVNPQLGTVVQSAPLQSADSSTVYIWYPVGAWTADRIVVGLPHSVSAYEPGSLALSWTYTEGQNWEMREIVSSNRGETMLLMGRVDTGEAQVVVLDTATGALQQRLPLPFPAIDSGDGTWDGHIEVLPGEGILVSARDGAVAFLAESDPAMRPSVSPTTSYPAIGEEVELSVSMPPDAAAVLVRWGDGEPETLEPGAPLRHSYARAGDVMYAITVVHADGRTGSTVGVLHVGATPPPELTALQTAFAPENQNLTFGVLGIVITILGAAVTIGRHRRRFARLERELSAVEEIRMLSTNDPRGAVLSLKAYRDKLPEDLARRRIDDSQYQILDIRSGRLLKVLRTRMLGPFDTRLSPRYHRLLDAAFEDAILHPNERDALVAALEHEERLDAEACGEIRRILDDFTSERRS